MKGLHYMFSSSLLEDYQTEDYLVDDYLIERFTAQMVWNQIERLTQSDLYARRSFTTLLITYHISLIVYRIVHRW